MCAIGTLLLIFSLEALMSQRLAPEAGPSRYFMLWPVGFCVTGMLLSSPLSAGVGRLAGLRKGHRWALVLLMVVMYGVFVYLLSPVVSVLLDRLFGLPQHYGFTTLPEAYLAHFDLLTRGLLLGAALVAGWWLLYLKMRISTLEELATALQGEAMQHQLKSLRYQLRPHFLYNALNNISMLVRKGEAPAAVEGLASLGAVLSGVLGKDQQTLITLRDELGLLDRFIAIERLADDGVTVSCQVAAEAEALLVPPLILQPVTENAFRFAREGGRQAPRVEIRAQVLPGILQLTIFNSGPGLKGWSMSDANGVGLTNTIHRLRHIYGSDFSFTTHDTPAGVEVCLRMPAKKAIA